MSSASLQAEKSARQNELVLAEGKIERLREAKSQFVNIKTEIAAIRNGVHLQADQSAVWAGSNYTKYNSYTADTFVAMDYRNYLTRLERSIQTIEAKIRELESQRFELVNMISWLAGAIANALAEEAAATAHAAAVAAAASSSR